MTGTVSNKNSSIILSQITLEFMEKQIKKITKKKI